MLGANAGAACSHNFAVGREIAFEVSRIFVVDVANLVNAESAGPGSLVEFCIHSWS